MLHTGKDLGGLPGGPDGGEAVGAGIAAGVYKVREVNGKEEIHHLPDKSKWVLRAKEAAYGGSFSVAAVDEAWKVKSSTHRGVGDPDDG